MHRRSVHLVNHPPTSSLKSSIDGYDNAKQIFYNFHLKDLLSYAVVNVTIK